MNSIDNYSLTPDQEKIFIENRPLVFFTLNKLRVEYRTSDIEDICSEGFIGLLRACKTFDESLGIKFSTFASACIYMSMFVEARKLNRLERNQISLDSPISMSNTENNLDNKLTGNDLAKFMACDVDMAKKIDNINTLRRIKYLKEKNKKIVLMVMQGYTLESIGKEFGVSRQHISNMLIKIRKFLTAPVSELKNNISKCSIYYDVPEY